jgi:hypothetical protein
MSYKQKNDFRKKHFENNPKEISRNIANLVCFSNCSFEKIYFPKN